MKKTLWNTLNLGNKKIVIDEEKVETVTELIADDVYRIDNVPTTAVDYLNDMLQEYSDSGEYIRNQDDLIYFFETHSKYPDAIVKYIDDYPKPENVLIFNYDNYEFMNLLSVDTIKTYSWNNGKDKCFCAYELIVECSDDRITLDRFNGYQYITDDFGNHEYVHKVYELNGNLVKEPLYLIQSVFVFEGNPIKADIMTEKELITHLKKLNRKVKDYMQSIKEIAVLAVKNT